MLSILVIAGILAQPLPLSGPIVPRAPERPTIVQYDFNSRIRRPETSPEHAAILLLNLPAPVQARADEVFARRAALIDGFVARNLLLLQELDTAGKAGDKLDQLVLILRALEEVRPILEAGPMRDQVAGVLPAPDAGRFRSMVGEYWSAVLAESLRDARAAGKRNARWQIDLGERFRHLGAEIAQSYERQVASGTLIIDYLMTGLDLTPEQVTTINGLKLDMLQRAGMRPAEKDQQQLAVGALAYLNPEQRAKVIKRLTGK
jgi:hypothetical protein